MMKYYDYLLKSPFWLAVVAVIIGVTARLPLPYQAIVCVLIGLFYTFKNKDVMTTGFKLKYASYFTVIYIMSIIITLFYGASLNSYNAAWVLLAIPTLIIKIPFQAFVCLFGSFVILLISNMISLGLVKISEFKHWIKYTTKPFIILVEKPKYLLVVCLAFVIIQFTYASLFYEKGNFKLIDKMPNAAPDVSSIVPLKNGNAFILQHNQFTVFNPKKRKFVSGGFLMQNTNNSNAIQLNNGKVLIVGTLTTPRNKTNIKVKDVFGEIYDPLTNKTYLTGKNLSPIFAFSAIKLQDGRILIAGGAGNSNKAQIFDPKTEKFHLVGNLKVGRIAPLMIPLNSGKVIVIGSRYMSPSANENAEEFDSKTETFKVIKNPFHNLNATISFPMKAFKLNDGRAAILWSFRDKDSKYSDDLKFAISVYNPEMTHIATTQLKSLDKINGFATVMLDNNNILFMGGRKGLGKGRGYDILNTASVFNTKKFKLIPVNHKMNIPRVGLTAAVVPDGNVLILKGYNNKEFIVKQAELFIP